MELLDKLTILAVDAANRANSVIETGKLSLKINSEESKILEFTLDLGELLVDKLDNGLALEDDEIKALYSSIVAARETIAGYEAEIEANRPAEVVDDPAPDAAEQPVCAKCGAPLDPDAKFCDQCGTKVEEEPAPEEVPAEEPAAPAVCNQCGAELKEDAKFCSQCGTPVPEKDA